MAKKLNYPHDIKSRHSGDIWTKLMVIHTQTGIAPAVLVRMAVEKFVNEFKIKRSKKDA